MDIAAAKKQARSDLKERFAELKSKSTYPHQHQLLLSNLVEWLKDQQGIWACYQAMDSELDLQPLPQLCSHLTWVYPVVSESRDLSGGISSRLDFWIPGPAGFLLGHFGIREPARDGGTRVDIKQVAGFLVPGLGFDKQGVRLGRGKGYYDRVLTGTTGLKVGVTLEDLLQEKLPEEIEKAKGADVRMDFLITEKRKITISTGTVFKQKES